MQQIQYKLSVIKLRMKKNHPLITFHFTISSPYLYLEMQCDQNTSVLQDTSLIIESSRINCQIYLLNAKRALKKISLNLRDPDKCKRAIVPEKHYTKFLNNKNKHSTD